MGGIGSEHALMVDGGGHPVHQGIQPAHHGLDFTGGGRQTEAGIAVHQRHSLDLAGKASHRFHATPDDPAGGQHQQQDGGDRCFDEEPLHLLQGMDEGSRVPYHRDLHRDRIAARFLLGKNLAGGQSARGIPEKSDVGKRGSIS